MTPRNLPCLSMRLEPLVRKVDAPKFVLGAQSKPLVVPEPVGMPDSREVAIRDPYVVPRAANRKPESSEMFAGSFVVGHLSLP